MAKKKTSMRRAKPTRRTKAKTQARRPAPARKSLRKKAAALKRRVKPRRAAKASKPAKAAAKPRAERKPARATRAPRRSRAPKPSAAPKPARLERDRRRLSDNERLDAAQDMGGDRMIAAARSGHDELRSELQRHTETSPTLTAGDVDAKWQDAYSVGDEAPGGDNPTPDQDRVDDIGKALGVQYQDDEELQGGDEIGERDHKRWELDPASSDDWPHKE